MTTSVSVHHVAGITMSTSEANGTRWTTITVYDEHEDALELTLFNSANINELYGVQYDNDS